MNECQIMFTHHSVIVFHFKAEAQHPGFTFDLVTGILQKAEVDKRVDMSECMLRLEGTNSCTGD